MPLTIRTVSDVLDYLNAHTDYEKQLGGRTRDTFDLERMHEVCDAMARPDLAYAAAHVAGTKGKGSTCRYLAAALASQGLKVGLYTSPHLGRINERIEIKGKAISDAKFVKAFTRVVETLEGELGGGKDLTFFELLTLAAMVAFSDAKVDIVVWEVGLGGRLDATNVISPGVCVITEIGLDHTQQLGDTIAEIAREKAGIIKPGVPVVCGASHPEAVKVITYTARDNEAPVIFFGRDYHLRDFAREGSSVRFTAAIRDQKYALTLPTPAKHLAENACHALAALEILNADEDLLPGALDREKMIAALRETEQPARFEIFGEAPRIVIDSAHNEVSLKATMQTARAIKNGSKLVLVCGVAKDKDLEACLPPLAEAADAAVFTTYASPRCCDAQTLLALYTKFGGSAGEMAKNPKDALKRAREIAGKNGLIVVTGSTYLAGELRAQVL
jgi:dihydrofolate synthase/folylpolyglutamate synthase